MPALHATTSADRPVAASEGHATLSRMEDGGAALERYEMWVSRAGARADLAPVGADNLEGLVAAGRRRTVAAGTVLAAADAPVDQVLIVQAGEVHLAKRRNGGGRHVVGIADALCVIGDIPLFCGHPWPFDVVAAKPSQVIEIASGRLLELLSTSGELAVQWAASIAKRFELTQRRQVVMLTKELRPRVATFLLEERRRGESGAWQVRLTQETIGQLLGARRQSIARVLRELRAAGLTGSSYGAIVLEDLQGLAEIAGEPLEVIPCAGIPDVARIDSPAKG